MESVIEVKELSRDFGDLRAVDRVSFDIRAGEVFGFLGPNGAGKSTTVRMLTGVIEPTSGTAAIRDHDITREAIAAREHLGIVPEEANVYPDLSVWHNVMLMGELHHVPRRERQEEGERLLRMLGLGDRKKQKAQALSKGLRQRLMLCSALVSKPEILFLDEPTSGLDVHSARLMRDIVKQMNADGLTVFLTTHNMAEAEEVCDRVAIINHGLIVAIDTPGQLQEVMQSNHYVAVAFQNGAIAPSQLEKLAGVVRVKETEHGFNLYTEEPGQAVKEVVKFADTNGLEFASLATCKPSLEDVFMHLTSS